MGHIRGEEGSTKKRVKWSRWSYTSKENELITRSKRNQHWCVQLTRRGKRREEKIDEKK
jgi:hypothetical protein